MQAHVAIHEAGHAVAGIYGANIMPTDIVSKTASLAEGHCTINLPSLITKDVLTKDIIISLGGYVAEKLVFGEENLSIGTGGDFERATNIALDMAKTYGMENLPMLIGQKNANNNSYWNSEKVDEMDKCAERIIKDCEKVCEELIKDNMHLLLKIGEYLSVNSRMDKKMITKFVEDFGKPVEIKKKNTYYSFKKTISDKLDELS